jgi:hypothetical protein
MACIWGITFSPRAEEVYPETKYLSVGTSLDLREWWVHPECVLERDSLRKCECGSGEVVGDAGDFGEGKGAVFA